MTSKPLSILHNTRSALVAERAGLLEVSPEEFDPNSQARVSQITTDLREIDERLAELASERESTQRAAKVLRPGGSGIEGSGERVNAGGVRMQVQDRPLAEVYTRYGQHSFFGDILAANLRNDRAAIGRLTENEHAQGRAVSTLAGSAGQFAPPSWLVNEYVKLARPSRVAADLMVKRELPQGVATINLPKVATGTTVGVTQTQNTVISNTDITSTSVSSGITTISGQQVLSLESIYQAGTDLDLVVLQDLALAVGASLESQVLVGTGTNGNLLGLANVIGATSVAYTTAAPALTSTTNANSLYYAVVKAQNAIATGRYLPATAIIMHPRRWAWISTQLDTTNRPIVPANSAGESYNAAGSIETVAASGRVGTLAGLPVYTSAQVPTNLGAATNQDQIYVLRREEPILWESELQLQTFEATYANQNSVLVRALEFAAFIPHRYEKAIAVIGGTGLVDPGM